MIIARSKKPPNNQMQGTQQAYLSFVVSGRIAPSLDVKRRLKGAPDLRPLCALSHCNHLESRTT